MKLHYFPETMWLGTQHSLEAAIAALGAMAAFTGNMPEEEEELPHNLSIQGEVAVVRIAGPLINSDTPYARYFGVSTYNDIRTALIAAVGRQGVKSILLDISSGGGAVAGVEDTANLIRKIDKQIMPVYACTDGVMASAAYWIGAAARKVYASSTAVVGSVGVMQVHQENTAMLEKMGVKTTVMRAGEFKALANPHEPLSAAARNQAEGHLQAIYGVFIGHVADCRGVTVDHADSTMGQGREFVGRAALVAGLIDGVESFDGVMSKVQASLLDSGGMSENNLRKNQGNNMPRHALTEQEIAALAAGAPISAGTQPENAPAAPEAAAPEAAAPAAPEAAAPEAAAPAPAAQPNAVVAYLEGQVASLNAQSIEMGVKLKDAEAKLVAAAATTAALMQIAAKSLSNMKVALGGAAVDFSAMTPEVLLAEHAATTESFSKAFVAGGVAAVSSQVQTEAATPAFDPIRQRRVQAAI